MATHFFFSRTVPARVDMYRMRVLITESYEAELLDTHSRREKTGTAVHGYVPVLEDGFLDTGTCVRLEAELVHRLASTSAVQC
jgi:hypothetical protein